MNIFLKVVIVGVVLFLGLVFLVDFHSSQSEKNYIELFGGEYARLEACFNGCINAQAITGGIDNKTAYDLCSAMCHEQYFPK